MAVHIIKSAQNKASIMNSSVGSLLTEEYFTVVLQNVMVLKNMLIN